ncbi:hypothetical protein [Georgenia faecalis]|uniref:Uncharacterized protein n=1 Tax=Georgenia faecalis TaxID=2483799 RepID=A0ABV9DAT0_9MICO|nr:hypothetical protein [Georgenia faecalis]
MIRPAPSDVSEDVARQYVVGRAIFMAAAYTVLALVLLMFASGLLAGGQFGPLSDTKWDVIVPWPAVPVPAALMVVVCLLAPVGALVLAPKARWEDAPDFLLLLAMTVVLFVVMPIGFSRMYPEAGGPAFDEAHPELGLARHWMGALPQVVTLAVLGVRFARLAPVYNAARRRALENRR